MINAIIGEDSNTECLIECVHQNDCLSWNVLLRSRPQDNISVLNAAIVNEQLANVANGFGSSYQGVDVKCWVYLKLD